MKHFKDALIISYVISHIGLECKVVSAEVILVESYPRGDIELAVPFRELACQWLERERKQKIEPYLRQKR